MVVPDRFSYVAPSAPNCISAALCNSGGMFWVSAAGLAESHTRTSISTETHYCFNTVSPNEKHCFYPLGSWQYSNSHKLETHTKSQHTVCNRSPRGKANAQWFLLVGQVPLYSKVCFVKVALKRAQLRVRACTDRLLIKPCDHPASSIRPRICSVGRTMTPSQLQDTTKMRSQQGQKDQTNESSGLYHLGRSGSHLYRVQSCPKAGS